MIDQSILSLVETINCRMDKADIILFCMRDLKLVKNLYFMYSNLWSKEVPKHIEFWASVKTTFNITFGL